MGVGRVHRLLRLITVLQRDEPNTTAGLMRELGVSRRTFFRDLKLLDEAGVPYRHDRAQGYRIDKSFYLPPINLTVPETLGLMMLGKSAAADRDRPMVAPALSAIYKLIATIPDPIREACSDLMANVSIAPDVNPIGNMESRCHTTLQRCIDQGRTCRIVYQSPEDEDELHAMFNPYTLHFVNRAWYVMGYTDVHDEVRMLKLVRFIEVQVTDEPFDRPENFHVEDKLGAAWRLIPEGKEYNVAVVFTKKVATNVSEVLWHKSQKHKILDDGQCEVTFTIDGIGEIAWWLCGYGDQVQIKQPAELRDRVKTILRSALKQYESRQPLSTITLGHKPKARPKKNQAPS
jgi:predicted DNA-binding transcriptional regulator YafY